MKAETLNHGTIGRYRGGCRCDKCERAFLSWKRLREIRTRSLDEEIDRWLSGKDDGMLERMMRIASAPAKVVIHGVGEVEI